MNLRRLCIHCMRYRKYSNIKCPYCGFDINEYETKRPALSPYGILDGRYLVGSELERRSETSLYMIIYIGKDIYLDTDVKIYEYFSLLEPYSERLHFYEKLSGTTLLPIETVRDSFLADRHFIIITDYFRGMSITEYCAKTGIDPISMRKLGDEILRTLEKEMANNHLRFIYPAEHYILVNQIGEQCITNLMDIKRQ